MTTSVPTVAHKPPPAKPIALPREKLDPICDRDPPSARRKPISPVRSMTGGRDVRDADRTDDKRNKAETTNQDPQVVSTASRTTTRLCG